jgi:hypothetical protein
MTTIGSDEWRRKYSPAALDSASTTSSSPSSAGYRTDDTDDTDAPADNAAPEADPEAAPKRPRKAAPENLFTGQPIPLQVRLPSDLVRSLKLLSYDTNTTLAELVLQYLTTSASCPKVHVSKRHAG